MMVFVAVDVGKRRCVTCVMGEDGSILDSGSYPNTMFDASHYARQTVEKYGECKAVVESTGNMCMKTYEAFESNGVEVKLEKVIVKEIPEPTEKSMLVKLLMSLGEKYELAGSTIEVRVNEVRASDPYPVAHW
jgi:hypothetical protein